MVADSAVYTAHAREHALPCGVHDSKLGGGGDGDSGGGDGWAVAALGSDCHR